MNWAAIIDHVIKFLDIARWAFSIKLEAFILIANTLVSEAAVVSIVNLNLILNTAAALLGNI